jgi:DNA-binding CsgD family transcriptional regulator
MTPFVSPTLDLVLSTGPEAVYLLLVPTTQYPGISDNIEKITGYKAEVYYRQGLPFLLSLVHPEDQPCLARFLRMSWEFHTSLPPHQRKQYKASFSFRIGKAGGKYQRLLQQHTLRQTDQAGYSTHSLGVISDLSHVKTQDSGSFALLFPHTDEFFSYPATDLPLKPTAIFTRREQQILRLLTKGYTSKQIARQLCLSCYTVDTHRRNLCGKAGVKNVSALIMFAVSKGLV